MDFQVGDVVVHWAYGPGEIVELDEKVLAGIRELYCVVQIRDMMVWVPVKEGSKSSLRLPTPAAEFEKLFEILKSPGELLSTDRLERKNQLLQNMRAGNLEGICLVIRDLNLVNQKKKLNDNDAALMERARNLLLSEWVISLGVSLQEAERELDALLELTV